jgi:PEP-CTERM motif
MFKKLVSGAIFGLVVASGPGTMLSVLVGTGLMAGVSTAEAQLRVGTAKYRPPYGDPFPGLDFFGEVKVTDGGCSFTGLLSNNLFCGGSMSIVSAQLNFGGIPPNINDTPVALQTINYSSGQFGQVLAIDRTNLTSWSGVTSTAFRAVQGTVDPFPADPPSIPAGSPTGTQYLGNQAWFSLVLNGTNAQVIWFENDPGEPIFSGNDPLSGQYALCFFAGPGETSITDPLTGKTNVCGVSEFDLGKGAPFLKDDNGNLGFAVTVVPEPEAYAMGLAGLGVIGFMTLISRRRAIKT